MAVPREEIYGYLRDAVGWVGSNSCRSCAATPEKDRNEDLLEHYAKGISQTVPNHALVLDNVRM